MEESRKEYLKHFIGNYNWKDIEFPSHSKDWRKFEPNNKAITLDIVCVPYNTKQIRPAYISKYNYKRDNQVYLLMINSTSDHLDYFLVKNNDDLLYNNNWHCLALKNVPGLLRGITSKHNGNFYCLNGLHSYTTKKKLKKHEKICKNHGFCYVNTPHEKKAILKYIP